MSAVARGPHLSPRTRVSEIPEGTLYSIVTILILFVFGALTGSESPRLSANLPTPWIGLWERINIYGFLLWVMVLAVALLRARDATAVTDRQGVGRQSP